MHASQHQDVTTVLKGKHNIRWQALLRGISYRDWAVVEDVFAGFRLAGMAPPFGVYLGDVRPRSNPREELPRAGKWIRLATSVVGSNGSGPAPDGEIDGATSEDAAAGWTKEVSLPELIAAFGEDWFPSRRCGIRQGITARCVDASRTAWLALPSGWPRR